MIALRFTEWVDGYVALGEEDSNRGFAAAKREGLRMSIRLELSTVDLDTFMKSAERLLRVDGEISHPLLGNTLAARGTVNQLIDVEGDQRHKTMPYRLEFTDANGRSLILSGLKRVDPPLRDAWKDTTTIDVLILEAGQAIGAGIVHIRFLPFLRQFTTYRCSGGTFLRRAVAPLRFYASFLAKLWDVYGIHLKGGR